MSPKLAYEGKGKSIQRLHGDLSGKFFYFPNILNYILSILDLERKKHSYTIWFWWDHPNASSAKGNKISYCLINKDLC